MRTSIQLLNFSPFLIFLLIILLIGCKSQPINLYDETANPCAQFHVEGHMGVVMTSCLGIPPQSHPIRTSSKGPLIDQKNYFIALMTSF